MMICLAADFNGDGAFTRRAGFIVTIYNEDGLKGAGTNRHSGTLLPFHGSNAHANNIGCGYVRDTRAQRNPCICRQKEAPIEGHDRAVNQCQQGRQ